MASPNGHPTDLYQNRASRASRSPQPAAPCPSLGSTFFSTKRHLRPQSVGLAAVLSSHLLRFFAGPGEAQIGQIGRQGLGLCSAPKNGSVASEYSSGPVFYSQLQTVRGPKPTDTRKPLRLALNFLLWPSNVSQAKRSRELATRRHLKPTRGIESCPGKRQGKHRPSKSRVANARRYPHHNCLAVDEFPSKYTRNSVRNMGVSPASQPPARELETHRIPPFIPSLLA